MAHFSHKTNFPSIILIAKRPFVNYYRNKSINLCSFTIKNKKKADGPHHRPLQNSLPNVSVAIYFN